MNKMPRRPSRYYIPNPVAYSELVSRGVSERRKCKWLVRVGASNGVTPLIKKNHGRGGGVSGQPENPPGYATAILDISPTLHPTGYSCK